MRTFVNWSGNKSKHINKFKKYIPENVLSEGWDGTYIEPFVGSGALLLNLEPENWIINDLNKDLINIWKSVKGEPKSIISIFKKFGKTFVNLSDKEKLEKCKRVTNKINTMPYDINRVANFLIMKSCAYMGNIFIKNRFYFPNLNSGNNIFLNIKMHENILNVSEYLNDTNGKIYNKDYKEILKKSKKNDFVFLDPPYIEKHNYQFNYNKDEIIDDKFIKDLLKELIKLDKRGVIWMMTQADTKFIRNVFKNHTIKTFKVYRAQGKKYVNELVIMNY